MAAERLAIESRTFKCRLIFVYLAHGIPSFQMSILIGVALGVPFHRTSPMCFVSKQCGTVIAQCTSDGKSQVVLESTGKPLVCWPVSDACLGIRLCRFTYVVIAMKVFVLSVLILPQTSSKAVSNVGVVSTRICLRGAAVQLTHQHPRVLQLWQRRGQEVLDANQRQVLQLCQRSCRDSPGAHSK